MSAPICTQDITGLVLAGGRGTRMGGIDKGLEPFDGVPLALHALRRLAPQVGTVAINANRHRADYESFGVPVWPDAIADHPGPLAGFLVGLQHCPTDWLLTVPCDSPLFPYDLAARLAEAAASHGADVAVASAPEFDADGASALRPQPVFCLLRATLQHDLQRFMQSGGRKVGAWTSQQRCVVVPFDREGDAPDAFCNANTHAELLALQASAPHPP